MGYVYLKGAFKAKALNEYDLDYHLADSISVNLKRRNIKNQVFDTFDFEKLQDFSRHTSNKMVSYAEDFCVKNNLDRLILVIKKDAYTISDPMQMFFGFDHDYGIASLSMYDQRAMLFYNLYVVCFTKGKNKFEKILNPSYKSHLFSSVLFDKEKLTLINDEVEPYFKNLFDLKIKETLDKIQ